MIKSLNKKVHNRKTNSVNNIVQKIINRNYLNENRTSILNQQIRQYLYLRLIEDLVNMKLLRKEMKILDFN